MKIHREKAANEVTYERLVLDDGFTFYMVWFANIVAPDGTKTHLESNPYY